MDSAPDITSCSQDTTAKVAGDSFPVDKPALGNFERTDDETDLSRLASMRIDGTGDPVMDSCAVNDITQNDGCLNDVGRDEGSSHKLLDNPDSSEQNGKIPNRDSGIDSPSCTVEGEVFPNEDVIDEEDNYDSVTETESVSCCVTLDNKRDSTQDEDSDLDEGSSGEIHSLTDTQIGYLTDTHSEAQKVSTSLAHHQQVINTRTKDRNFKSEYRHRLATASTVQFRWCVVILRNSDSLLKSKHTSHKFKSFISACRSCNGKK